MNLHFTRGLIPSLKLFFLSALLNLALPSERSFSNEVLASAEIRISKRCVPGEVKQFKSKHRSFRTGYYPHDSEMEGGFVDRRGQQLRTLQDYLDGEAEYVSVAMDHLDLRFPYGTRLRIPEIESEFNRCIEFRVVDTGGRFKGKGTQKIDICNRTLEDTLEPYSNGWTTIFALD